jgi:hypothetical protein
MLNGCDILLELVDFCICNSNFLVIGSKTIKFSSNSPVFEVSCMFEQNQELRIQPSKHRLEPLREWSGRGVIRGSWCCIDGDNVWGIMRPILGGKAGDVAIIVSFDPLGREVEASPNGDLEVWEVHVFNIPFGGLVVGFLIIGHFISESLDLLTKLVFHLTVDCFMGPDGFE